MLVNQINVLKGQKLPALPSYLRENFCNDEKPDGHTVGSHHFCILYL
jgi:hypothetical protein